jgi:ribosome recycling factor
MSMDSIVSEATEAFEKALNHLKDEFARLQVGRASPLLVEDIPVDMYGNTQPIKALASITIPDPRSLVIQPWDKSALAAIEKAIVGIGVGLNPINDGVVVRINMPMMTEERRKELSKLVKKYAEDAKITVRNARQDAHNTFKKMKNDNDFTEDDLHTADKKLQTKVDDANHNIDEAAAAKEKDVMTV